MNRARLHALRDQVGGMATSATNVHEALLALLNLLDEGEVEGERKAEFCYALRDNNTGKLACILGKGHDGDHRGMTGAYWPNEGERVEGSGEEQIQWCIVRRGQVLGTWDDEAEAQEYCEGWPDVQVVRLSSHPAIPQPPVGSIETVRRHSDVSAMSPMTALAYKQLFSWIDRLATLSPKGGK